MKRAEYNAMRARLKARRIELRKARPKRKSDRAKRERDARIVMGDAEHTEYLRTVRVALDQSPFGQGDDPLYLDELRRRRYSAGGLHDRLRAAAKRQSDG